MTNLQKQDQCFIKHPVAMYDAKTGEELDRFNSINKAKFKIGKNIYFKGISLESMIMTLKNKQKVVFKKIQCT